jgi:cysteinyl-tRNA synthetase
MSQLKLHDTQSNTKKVFLPRDSQHLTMYVCGPTVYDTPHIGNARPVVVFDILYRLLRSLYPEARIDYARNYTDVDDKIIARSREREITIAELCQTTIAEYERVMGALAVLDPTIKPRATDNIDAMTTMIGRLIEAGSAYEAEGHVLFDTTTYPQGVLTGQTEGRDRARIDEVSYKRHQSDFVLWKPADGDVGWGSPWGDGRPGWHIECSAMIHRHLGDQIDIHGGGQDLIFPHHEAECAQSETATGTALARYWVHNAMVLADGQKMSKSLGNFITVADVLAVYPGEALKFAMLHTHYRHPFDFRWVRVQEALATLRRLKGKAVGEGVVDPAFLDALYDDLNTPLAIARLHDMPPENIMPSLAMLGLDGEEAKSVLPNGAQQIMDERTAAREAKDWARSDELRDRLLREYRIVVRDTPKGMIWERVIEHQ